MKFSWKKKLNDLDAKEEQRWRKRKGPMAKRYFDDFEVRTVLGKNGKTKRELIYIGDTYTAQVSDQVYQRRKWVFLALATLCAAVFVGGQQRQCRQQPPRYAGCSGHSDCNSAVFGLLCLRVQAAQTPDAAANAVH